MLVTPSSKTLYNSYVKKFNMIEVGNWVKHGKPMLIFTYSTEHLPNKDKVRFYYALKGRDGKTGIVKEYKITHLGRTVLMVPADYEKDILEFIESKGGF